MNALHVGGTQDEALRRMLVLRLQRLLPYLSVEAIDARAQAAGLFHDMTEDDRAHPVAALDRRLRRHPEILEPDAAHWRSREDAVLQALVDGSPATGTRSYRIEQTVVVHDHALAEGAVLKLWIPVPRHVPGVQRVTLVECEPPGLRAHHVPRAGQIYGVALLIRAGASLAPLRLVFDVERAAPGLIADPDPDLVLTELSPGDEAEVVAWLGGHAADASGQALGQALIEQVVDRMAERCEVALCEADTGAAGAVRLAREGRGDLEAHADLLAKVLRSRGLATRVGAAQKLMLTEGASCLQFDGSWGFDHHYVDWRDVERGVGGVVDMSIFARPGSAAARQVLACGHYPLDLILGGHVPRPQLLEDGGRPTAIDPPVHVEIRAHGHEVR